MTWGHRAPQLLGPVLARGAGISHPGVDNQLRNEGLQYAKALCAGQLLAGPNAGGSASPTLEGALRDMTAGVESPGAAQAMRCLPRGLALAEVGDTWEGGTRRGSLSSRQLLAWLGPVQVPVACPLHVGSEDLWRMEGLDGLSGLEALGVKSRWGRKELSPDPEAQRELAEWDSPSY